MSYATLLCCAMYRRRESPSLPCPPSGTANDTALFFFLAPPPAPAAPSWVAAIPALVPALVPDVRLCSDDAVLFKGPVLCKLELRYTHMGGYTPRQQGVRAHAAATYED